MYDEAKRIYGLYGKEENLSIFEDPACHGYTLPLAEQAAAFFCRVFGVEMRQEPRRGAFPIHEMRCTVSGNVKGDFPDAKTLPDETAAEAMVCRAARAGVSPREWLRERVEFARLPQPPRPRIADNRNRAVIDGYVGRSMMWWVQKRLAAYGMLITREEFESDGTPCPVVIALWNNGTRAIGDHEDWIRTQCDAHKQVLVVDLPGMGNIQQPHLWGWAGYRDAYGTMYKMCCDLMYMDDSMAAMQTYHLLRTADMLRDTLHTDGISLYCDDGEGVYGVMAGYLTGLSREYGEHLLCNVERQILSQRPLNYDNTLSYVLPGMLRYFDYDEIM